MVENRVFEGVLSERGTRTKGELEVLGSLPRIRVWISVGDSIVNLKPHSLRSGARVREKELHEKGCGEVGGR